MTDAFDPDCLARPPYRFMHGRFRDEVQSRRGWPPPEQYDELVRLVPRPASAILPCFVRQNRESLREAGGYERHVAERRAVPTRPDCWHDFFNMAVWAHFPALRWALNSLHVDPGTAKRDPRNGRTPGQNLATSFDETGMLVISRSRAVLEGLRALRFKHVFWELRAELAETTHFWIVGHGLLESLVHPHPRLVARSLLLHLPGHEATSADELRAGCDAAVARGIEGWRERRIVFDPIPAGAIPGFADNDSPDFYDDRQRLPFEPVSRRPAAPIESLG
jgi:hypothetical protein